VIQASEGWLGGRETRGRLLDFFWVLLAASNPFGFQQLARFGFSAGFVLSRPFSNLAGAMTLGKTLA
jgi:hypothetical protein